MGPWKTEKSELVLDTPYLQVRKDAVTLPGGAHIDDFYAVTFREASAVVALDTQGNLILKQEYRYSCGQELTEIPAGSFEPGETDPLAVAKRELLEETGYVSDNWQYFGPTVESSSKLTSRMHIFLAQDCRKVSGQHLDETEEVAVLTVPFARAVEMVMTNEICCSGSAHGILRAARMLGK